MDSINYFYKLNKEDLSFVTTLIESFEGIAAVRTPDPKPGKEIILHAMVSPDYKGLFEQIIRDIGKQVKIKRVKYEIINAN